MSRDSAKLNPLSNPKLAPPSSSLTPKEPKELGKAQAADAKQPKPPSKPKSPQDRRPESTKGKSHGEAQSNAGWVDLTPSSNKQRLSKADAKQPQPPGTSKSPPDRKPENVSGLSLDDALKVKVPTDLEASAKYVRDMRAVIVTTDKKSFKLARRIGVVVKAHRDATPHANTKGVDQSWEDRCKTTFGFTARSSQNYMALLAIPEDTDITLRDAYIQVGVYKIGGTDEAATDSNYKEQLLAMLTPVQRTNEVNGKLPQEFDGDDLALIVQTMTGLPKNRMPKKPSSTTPQEPKRPPQPAGDDDGDTEQARMELAKERVDVVKRIVKRFVDAGKELVAETAKMKKEIKDGTYTGANYSSAKEGAAFVTLQPSAMKSSKNCVFRRFSQFFDSRGTGLRLSSVGTPKC